jgi:hypothetical protein
MATLPASAQFETLTKQKLNGRLRCWKKIDFNTVWESEFENKVTRIAVVDGDGRSARNRHTQLQF